MHLKLFYNFMCITLNITEQIYTIYLFYSPIVRPSNVKVKLESRGQFKLRFRVDHRRFFINSLMVAVMVSVDPFFDAGV